MTRKEQLEAKRVAKLQDTFGENYKETAEEIVNLFEPFTLYRLKDMKTTLKAFHKRNGRIKKSVLVEEFKLATNITKGAFLDCVSPGVYLIYKTSEQFHLGMELDREIWDYLTTEGSDDVMNDIFINGLLKEAKLSIKEN